ncbi:MAG: 2OG-Fe(II) oxygenase [Bryobacteraceae bacterium]
MLALLRPELAGRADELRSQFRSNPPFPHLVIDDFLAPEFCALLQGGFPRYDASVAINEAGRVGGKAVFQDVANLGPAYAEFDRLIQSGEFLRFLSQATGIPSLLYDPAYVGGGCHLNLHGQDLETHVDFNYHPQTKTHRRLNLILFLNSDWHEEWGGCLELQSDPHGAPEANQNVKVIPCANRCVIFETSERSWHGFERIDLPEEQRVIGRRTLAVYFYTKDRPKEETAPSHATFYVPRPLPDRFQAGMTLSEADLHEIRVLLQRRDDMIRFLYGRELEFGRMAESPTFRLAHAMAWPARKLRDLLRKQ